MTKHLVSLQQKTIAIVGVPLLLMVVTAMYLGYVTAKEKSLAQVSTTLEERTMRQAAELNLLFGDMARYADTTALTLSTVDTVTQGLESVLTRRALDNPVLGSCTIAYDMEQDATGRLLGGSTGDNGLPLSYRRSPSDEKESVYTVRLPHLLLHRAYPFEHRRNYIYYDWFLLPSLADKGMWTDPFFDERQQAMVVAYGTPFHRHNAFAGVVSLTASISAIDEKLRKINLEGSQLVLISQFGTVVVHPDPDFILRHTLVSLANDRGDRALQDFAYGLRGKTVSGVERFDRGILGDNEYVAYAPVPQTNWMLLSIIPESLVVGPLQRAMGSWVLWCLLGALALFVVIYALEAAMVLHPLQRLTQGTLQLGEGDFHIRVPETADTIEIAQLERSFNSMATRLEDGVRKVIEAGRAKTYAEEASKAKSDFLARMSHEIRTPMNAVLGFTHIALSRNPGLEQRDFLLKIQNAGRNMLSIINDILDFSKIEAGRLELENRPFRMRDVADDIRNMFGHAAEAKGLSFTVELEPDLPEVVVGDSLRISQICINLCNNALKFTPQGGVRVHMATSGCVDGRYKIVLRVQDSGIGIPKDAQEHLFTKFTQADTSTTRQFGGTGLGLAICRLLAELMDGGISLVSEEGEGTTFTVWFWCGVFTRELAESLPEKAVSAESKGSGFSHARILVAEDNEINQEIISSLLDNLGIAHDIAADGEEAVRMLRDGMAEGRDYHLVLMDMQMPRMDGLAATRAMRRLGATLPILAMTANAMSADRQRCLDAGMNAHLAKPIDPDLLRAQLAQWLPSC